MKTFSQAERICEVSFQNAGPFWHAYTPGKSTPILFENEDDLSFVMNVIAYAAFLFSPVFDSSGHQIGGLIILAFEVMNNHLHFVLSGERVLIEQFFDKLRGKLKRTIPNASMLKPNIKPIDSLAMLRNEIVYTNRNGYVAFPNYTPFSYPWGTGRYYYNDIPLEKGYGELTLTPKRKMFRGRAPELPDNWKIINGYIAPVSYCAINFGMGMFRDANHYFNAVSKQVEAYAGVAVEIDDGEFLTDTELFGVVTRMLQDKYKLSSRSQLSRAQKLDVARSLHFDYRSSNGQIRRVLGLSQYELDELFPFGSDLRKQKDG